jgi:hypothetical protein
MRNSLVGLVALALSLAFAPKADASLILAVDVNGSQACAADNGIGCAFGTVLVDLNPAVGIISLAPTVVGGVLVEGSLHTATVSATGNLLSSGSLAITNQLATTAIVQASIGATDFVGPTSFVQATGSGTWVDSAGSSTTYTYYNDLLNAQGAETATDRPGLQVASFTDVAQAGLDSFSFDTGNLSAFDPTLFSMTLGFDMTLLGFDRLETRGQAEFKDIQAVPEPMTLLLLGSGLVGGGYLRRRQKA